MKNGIKKTIISVLLAVFIIAVSFPCTVKEAKAAGGDCAIVVSANASSTEIYAAETLQEYLYELDFSYCNIITDDQPFDGFKFCVGSTSVYDTNADLNGKAPDSYVIAPFDNGLAIFGAGGRGTLYGVHTFLEDYCGFKCYAWYPVMVKTSDRMTLPEEKIVYEPYFEYRNTDWRSGWMSLYSVSHKLNGVYQYYVPEQGGNVPYLGGSACHTLSTAFCSAGEYFESHPEYFALHNGQRSPGQLCLTNENVYSIVLQEVLDVLEAEYNSESDLQIISLSQADNLDYCECESCRALDEANGSHAGSLITFVNRIASAVKEEGYNNVAFDTLAYTYSRKAPSEVVPEDNVIVSLCTFECCFSHSLDDPDCPANRDLMEDLEDWSGICSRIYIWDYTTNFAYTLGVFPDFGTLQKNMQCFYTHGVKGVYEEGNYYVDRCDTEFGELRTYLIAELMEDPYCNLDAKMLEFCNYYYGSGGQYVKQIVDELTACTKGHLDIYCRMGDTFSIDEEKAEYIDGLWALAESASQNSEDALEAIERSKLSWRYVKAVLGLREFGGTLEENRDAREALFNDLIAHGVKMIDEWTWIEEDFSEYELIPVEEWEFADRFFYLHYDLNGGTAGPYGQWAFDGRISDIIPARTGFTFLGWATDENASEPEYMPGDSISLSSDLTLYAVWEESGHDYQFSGFLWEEDFTAKAVYVCSYDFSHVVYYDAEVTSSTQREATCAEEGQITYTASYDGHTGSVTGNIPKNSDNHTGETELRNAREATCAAEGYTGDTYCAGCGVKISSGSPTGKKEHSWDGGEVTTPATCEAAGVLTYTCAVCEATKTETIAKLPHADRNIDGLCDECGSQLAPPSQSTNVCKWCGGDHSGSFIQTLLGFFHRIFAALFGARY